MNNAANMAPRSNAPQNGDILIHKDGSTYRVYRKAGNKLNEIATSTTFRRQRGISVAQSGGFPFGTASDYSDAPDFTKREIEKQGRALVEKYVPAAGFAADVWVNLCNGWADRAWQRLS